MTAASDSASRGILDKIGFRTIFREFMEMENHDERTEHFADLTEEEIVELKNIQLETSALDETLKQAMQFHTSAAGELRRRQRDFWDKVEGRLKDHWPKDGNVNVTLPFGKVYRKPNG